MLDPRSWIAPALEKFSLVEASDALLDSFPSPCSFLLQHCLSPKLSADVRGWVGSERPLSPGLHREFLGLCFSALADVRGCGQVAGKTVVLLERELAPYGTGWISEEEEDPGKHCGDSAHLFTPSHIPHSSRYLKTVKLGVGEQEQEGQVCCACGFFMCLHPAEGEVSHAPPP